MSTKIIDGLSTTAKRTLFQLEKFAYASKCCRTSIQLVVSLLYLIEWMRSDNNVLFLRSTLVVSLVLSPMKWEPLKQPLPVLFEISRPGVPIIHLSWSKEVGLAF
jgi:hypothetical protein